MTFAVVVLEAAVLQLRRIRSADPAAFTRASTALRALASVPYPADAVPWGGSGIWRLRAGDLRVLYEVDEEQSAVYIIRVDRAS